MSCRECEFDYLKDKTEVLETVVRRMSNILHESSLSSATTKTQQVNVKAFGDFAARWKGRACPHVLLLEGDGPGVTVEAGKVVLADPKRGPKAAKGKEPEL